ncbi:MAG TPA: YihY/virulence factor BrkB family protein [Solirubrobacteraceae bacterium]|jgi:membrane protein|nr:YihY/virulence factor BrkB family protein [Solirubrobacteraceae bacterium]
MSETTRDERFTEPARREPPEQPAAVGSGWLGVLKRSATEFKADNLTDWAAALTYYAILSIFPALLVLVSIVGLFGESATQSITDNLTAVAPSTAKDIVTNAVQNLSKSQGSAGILFVVGLAGALWSASGYIGAFMRASNAIYEVEEGRPFWKLRPVQLLVTFILLVLLAAVAIATVLTGGLAKQAATVFGVGDTALSVWKIAKWPVMVLAVAMMLAILYWTAPNVKMPKFRWVTPGGLIAVVLFIVASALFAFYVANFSSYNKTYGSLGAVISFLVWLWITNLAVLFGAEVNAELEREREIKAGVSGAHEEIKLEPRSPPKD